MLCDARVSKKCQEIFQGQKLDDFTTNDELFGYLKLCFHICFRPNCRRRPVVAIRSKVFEKNRCNHFDLSLAKVAKRCNHCDLSLAKVAKRCNHCDLSLAKDAKSCNDCDLSLAKVAKSCNHFNLSLHLKFHLSVWLF